MHRFLRRRLSGLFDLKFCAVVLALILFLSWLLWTGTRTWWVGLIGVVVFLIPAVVLSAYVAHWFRTVGRIRQMQVPMARFKLSETDVAVASELGSSTIPWSSIVEIWEFPELWLLLLSKSRFVTLPTDGVPAAALEFARAKVRSVHEGPLPHTAA